MISINHPELEGQFNFVPWIAPDFQPKLPDDDLLLVVFTLWRDSKIKICAHDNSKNITLYPQIFTRLDELRRLSNNDEGSVRQLWAFLPKYDRAVHYLNSDFNKYVDLIIECEISHFMRYEMDDLRE